ncbi:MAG: hypothetical protein ACRED1_02575, partial [Limisphaerales bacterium]
MLATPEIIDETRQLSRLEELEPKWRAIPLYRHSVSLRRNGQKFLDAFQAIPFIGKRQMREGFPILTSGQSLERLLERQIVEIEHTSGTSDEQLPVLFERGWWDEQEERALRLNPFVGRVLDDHPDARRATLTTPACNGRVCFSAWRSRANRIIGNTLYVNQARIPFVLTDDDLARMAEEIADWSPKFLDVDPVHAAWFALYCERKGIGFPSLEFVLCSYEFVSVVHKRILERVFGVPVFNLYGSTETGHLLMETGQGMKPCLENAFLEVVQPDVRGVGDLIVTTLTNDYMPLLRYRIGDLVERRTMPYSTTYVFHGRLRDAIRAGDGRRVTTWAVDQCLDRISGIVHYQVHKDPEGNLRFRYVSDSESPRPDDLKTAVARLEELLKPRLPIAVESVPMLPPTPSGKFRLTVETASS